MEKTLTDTALAKQAKRFSDSIDHASYTLDGAPKTIPIFKKSISGPLIKIYVYFDDTVTGKIENVQLVDTDGDFAASSPRTFTKANNKGLYVAFKYQFTELEVESVESI